jgi:hypothetical protein
LVRIAFTRGNVDLKTEYDKYDNTVLSGGIILNRFEPCRSDKTVRVNPQIDRPWSDDFHIYEMLWEEGT